MRPSSGTQRNGGMPMKGKTGKPFWQNWKNWVLLAVILLVLLSLALVAMRAIRWHRDQDKTRLLTLVDRDHPVEDDYNVEFTLLGDGQMVDSRCMDDLEDMLAACRQAGGSPEIAASFRTWGAQERLYEERLAELTDGGLSEEQAEAKLERVLEKPGFSEHQLGLAIDFTEQGSELPMEQQGDTPTLRWLAEESWRYGFILRYPGNKTEITGMDARPWHFRYVGREAAAQIRELDLSLEEYIELFYS